MKVRLTKDVDQGHLIMAKNSIIYVDSETKCYYKGLWCSSVGSYMVKVSKKFCKKVSSQSKGTHNVYSM